MPTLPPGSARPQAPWSLPTPDDVVGPARGPFVKHVARRLLDWTAPMPRALARDHQALREPLLRLLRNQPAAVLGALALPQVNGPILGGDLALAMPALLLELARRRILPAEGLWWGGPVDRLVSPMIGIARRFEPARAGMLFGAGWVETARGETLSLDPGAGDAVWALRHGGWLCTVDTNPLAMFEAHPDKAGNAVSLGGRPATDWLSAIDDARDRITIALPDLGAEHRGLLGTIIPVGEHPEYSSSASYKEVIGQIYLSLHPSVTTMAEAIVHETQHNKINLLSWLDPVIENGDERFPSPVRPDPRPMWGVLLAVHAFLPVAAMHRAWLDAGVPWADPRRFRQVCELNHDGMEVVRRHARPTPVGRRVIDGLDRLERALST